MPKARKGTVSVASQDGMLRLRWRHLSKPYTLALALADTPLHRRIAQGKASEIQADIAFDRFDDTLAKYRADRPETARPIGVISPKTIKKPSETINDFLMVALKPSPSAIPDHQTRKTIIFRSLYGLFNRVLFPHFFFLLYK